MKMLLGLLVSVLVGLGLLAGSGLGFSGNGPKANSTTTEVTALRGKATPTATPSAVARTSSRSRALPTATPSTRATATPTATLGGDGVTAAPSAASGDDDASSQGGVLDQVVETIESASSQFFRLLNNSPLDGGPRIKLRNSSAGNWSGYAIETNLTSPTNYAVTNVKGQWKVPAITCTSTATYSSIWVGLDGYSSGTVEQVGTSQNCSSGKPVYYAWYEMYPKAPVKVSVAVRPNDLISGEVSFSSKQFYLILRNLTTGKIFSTKQSSSTALRRSAEWIVEAPSSLSGILPLSDFGTVSFSNAFATVKGRTGTIGDPSWQYDPITMATATGTVKAQPSALSGSGFSVTWQSY